ncbi:MAG: pilus assembly protein N-terminal domain-containing protein [Nitrospirae bacterium]|nr:pilus assembly protein N-terminal domain-containing protein [Nitrospirota bacterium]
MNSRKKPLLFLTLLLLGISSSAFGADVTLSQGEKVKIPFDNLQRIIVADEKVIQVTVQYSEKKIEITGLEEGESELSFLAPSGGKKTLLVEVLKKTKSFRKKAQRKEINRDPKFREIETEIRNQARTIPFSVQVTEENITLKGEVYDNASRSNLEHIASTYGKKVVNLVNVVRPMVEMDVKIVQVDQVEGDSFGGNLLKNLGLTTDMGFATDIKPHLSLATQVQSSLNLLVNHGKAKVLSEPHLSCRTGDHATFHSGGEIGFRVSGVGHSSVKFKEYGLILQIEPNIVEQGKIESHITIEISAPTSSPTSSQDIGFTKFNADSHIVSRPNETIIIAGLAENIQHHFQEQTPLLGNIPVLSLFFSEKQDQHSRRDLLMIVTPTFTKVERIEDYEPASVIQKEGLEKEINGDISEIEP